MMLRKLIFGALLLISCSGEVDVLVLGDSYSAGTGSTTSWPELAFGDSNLKVIARNGYTTIDILSHPIPAADTAIIMIGVNDYVQGRSANDFKQSLEEIVKRTKLWTNSITIITIPDFTLSPTGLGYGSPAGIAEFNAVIQQVAKQYDLQLVDIQQMQLPASVYDDGLHPNAEGHALWADYIKKQY